MMSGIRPVTYERRDDRGDEEQDQDRALQLAAEHPPRPGAVTADRVRADGHDALGGF